MRLIDAEYVLWKVDEAACPQSMDFGQGRESVLDEIRRASTVDAEPVVRCKDCKFYKTQYCKIDIHTDIMTINRVHDDDFCSYGERGESEVTNG